MIPFIKRFSYLHLKNLDDLQPDETEVKGIVPSPRYNLRARAVGGIGSFVRSVDISSSVVELCFESCCVDWAFLSVELCFESCCVDWAFLSVELCLESCCVDWAFLSVELCLEPCCVD
ncbi:hypothetical protein TNCV_1764421 [Trichonephila clavipes]|nr:hypothetical protein TNCV_1764421 [Trichonephila clavipes]